MSRGQSFCSVNIPYDRLDAGRVSKAAEEFVRGEVGEPDPVHAASFAEHEFSGVECQDCVADPCGFAFDFKSFVAVHAGILNLHSRRRESFHALAANSLAESFLGLRVPVTGLEFHKHRAVGQSGRRADHEHIEALIGRFQKSD